MTAFLASVSNLEEARIVLDYGADIIDLKNPLQGALGALPHGQIKEIVHFINGRKPVSATIGDLPMQPEILLDAARAMSANGVDIIKVGFFGSHADNHCVEALAKLSKKTWLVAVMFADKGFDAAIIQQCANAGFYGVMLDTAEKNDKSLRDFLDARELTTFVDKVHQNSMMVGLAGSLRCHDVAPLLACAPDYLGFRGALCKDMQRGMAVEAQSVCSIHALLRESHNFVN